MNIYIFKKKLWITGPTFFQEWWKRWRLIHEKRYTQKTPVMLTLYSLVVVLIQIGMHVVYLTTNLCCLLFRHLPNNMLTTLPPNVFAGLKHLQYLYVCQWWNTM